MRTLKSKYYIVIPFFIVGIVSEVLSQNQPTIEIERVKNDLLNNEINVIPAKFIKNASASKFTILYVGNVCVAHLAFKDYLTESFMKSSMIAVYQINGKNWILKNVSPYYYSISAVDRTSKVFLSANEFCEPNASCNSFYELSSLNNEMEMIPLAQATGFDQYNYLLRLLILNRNEEVLKSKGDTISRNVVLSDIKMEGANVSFLETRTIRILQGIVSDSLVTSASSTKLQRKVKR